MGKCTLFQPSAEVLSVSTSSTSFQQSNTLTPMSLCVCVCVFAFQVLSVIPFKFVPEPVLIKVANHTECRCMEPAIIRRNAQPHRSSG